MYVKQCTLYISMSVLSLDLIAKNSLIIFASLLLMIRANFKLIGMAGEHSWEL